MNKNYELEIQEKIVRIIQKVIKGIIICIISIGIILILGFILMWLWNWLMTDIFLLREINYWEATGLFILAKIFFGFGGFSVNEDNSKSHIEKEKSQKFDKEFERECEKELGEDMVEAKQGEPDNQEYDRMYEQWWLEKGESSFAEYMKRNEKS